MPVQASFKVALATKSDEVTFAREVAILPAVKMNKRGVICAGQEDQAAGLPVEAWTKKKPVLCALLEIVIHVDRRLLANQCAHQTIATTFGAKDILWIDRIAMRIKLQ